MHNKRIGRDDMLKIEVIAHHPQVHASANRATSSGPALPPLPPGDLSLVVTATVVVVAALPVAAVPLRLAAALATTLPERMSAVTGIATTTAIVVATATVRAALILGMSQLSPRAIRKANSTAK